MNSIVKFVSSVIVWIVLAVLLVLFVAFFGVGLIGYKPYTVLSNSMNPAIPKGSMAYVQKVDPATLQVGDVITFERGAVSERETYYDIFGDVITLEPGTTYIFTHRIVSVDEENRSFVVKGDANEKEDPSPVGYDEVLGKVAYGIPVLGFVNVWLHTDMGRMVVIGSAVVFVFFIFLSSWQPKQEEEEEDDEEEDEEGDEDGESAEADAPTAACASDEAVAPDSFGIELSEGRD